MPLSVESTSYNLGAWARARENDCSITGLGLATTLRFLRVLRFHGIASMQPSFQQCRPIGCSQVALTARSFSGVTCSHPAPLQHLLDDSTVLIATRRRAECIGGSISAKSLVVRSVGPLGVCNLRAAEEVGTCTAAYDSGRFPTQSDTAARLPATTSLRVAVACLVLIV